MVRDSKARGPEVLGGMGQLDPEDNLQMSGQLAPLAGLYGRREDHSTGRRPMFHGSVGGSLREAGSGSSKKTFVHGQSWLVTEEMASGMGVSKQDPVRETIRQFPQGRYVCMHVEGSSEFSPSHPQDSKNFS